MDKSRIEGAVTATLASSEAMFEQRLERAARALCEHRGVEPDSLEAYNNGTLAYTRRPAWKNAAEVLRHAYVIKQLVDTL